jgi:hypothetical protein
VIFVDEFGFVLGANLCAFKRTFGKFCPTFGRMGHAVEFMAVFGSADMIASRDAAFDLI